MDYTTPAQALELTCLRGVADAIAPLRSELLDNSAQLRKWGHPSTRLQELLTLLDQIGLAEPIQTRSSAASTSAAAAAQHETSSSEGPVGADLVRDVLQQHPDVQLDVGEVLKLLEATGWRSTSKDPRNSVASLLNKAAARFSEVQRTGWGKYRWTSAASEASEQPSEPGMTKPADDGPAWDDGPPWEESSAPRSVDVWAVDPWEQRRSDDADSQVAGTPTDMGVPA